mmetsp:Transcript_62085/g.172055  ORF Transcript_62085/g.172055 Transcript_62085/m.172055 type:complete len:193 (-) Transcript_62085:188-766(-)
MFSWCCAQAETSIEEVPMTRTAAHDSLTPDEALQLLEAGNKRFVADATEMPKTRAQSASHREQLSMHGQNPAAIVIGCADSRCPIEILFDAQPGDIFVLRNAGNTCTHAEGSLVGSVEYATSHLGTNLVLVLGHIKCGAIAGATQVPPKGGRSLSARPPSWIQCSVAWRRWRIGPTGSSTPTRRTRRSRRTP